jgi:hypothetical protein
VPEPAKATARIGQRIFDKCGDTFPTVLHGVLEELRDVIVAAKRREDS